MDSGVLQLLDCCHMFLVEVWPELAPYATVMRLVILPNTGLHSLEEILIYIVYFIS